MRTDNAPAKGRAIAVHPFDYTCQLDDLIHHIIHHSEPFRHVDPKAVLTSWSQSRAQGEQGVYATIQCLRFFDGSETVKRGTREYRWPKVTFEGREILYVIFFMLPRYADLSFRSKLTTIFHELYHVDPECNGGLRRFPGRNYAHGHSREAYNARLQPWIDAYLLHPAAAEKTEFLNLTFRDLEARHRVVTGRRVKVVKPQLVRPSATPL
jgi:hypothetical protein